MKPLPDTSPTTEKTVAIVVTYNRRQLLAQCLRALGDQTRLPREIIVVDNASTDGTYEYLSALDRIGTCPVRAYGLTDNLGGAGGFAKGLRLAMECGADWVWMMDDDACPHPTALDELSRIATATDCVYGSAAVSNGLTSWATTLLGPPTRVVENVTDLPPCAEVESLPFLGFFVHRDLVRRIGLPDARYFIAADDMEYCLRARRAGAKLYIAGHSHIEHPKSVASEINVLGKKIIYLSLPPWKRYYDTRNRILNARTYAPVKLFAHVLPGTLIRFCVALRREPRKRAQVRSFLAGTLDGLLGRKGKRHTTWGIEQ